MYKDILQTIGGVTTFPIYGLILFGIVFVGVTIRAVLMDKRSVDHLSDLPLDDTTNRFGIGE